MKEFESGFNEGLVKGLRTTERNPRNSGALITCYNLKPYDGALKSYEPITDPFSGAIAVDWPFPQVFIGQDVRILATATQLFELTTWTPSAAKVTVSEDERWDFMDFGPYLILTNGTKLCIRDYSGAWTSNDSLSTIPRFATGCVFNGQLVAGNVKTTWHDCDGGSLIWSRIGDVDFTPGGDNEAGYRHTPWEGNVLRVMKLGKGVIVYCQNGIGVLTPYQQTFGWTKLADVGIKNKAAVAGNDKLQVCVTTHGDIVRIKSDFSYDILGYREYMNLMTSSNVVVEYDPAISEFHISDDDYGYVLTGQGLAQCYQEVTTIVNSLGVGYGVFDDQGNSGASILTDTVDFGLRGLKTLQTVEVAVKHSAGSLSAYAQWLSDRTSSFANGPSIPVTPNGTAVVTTTGADFRVGLTFSDYTDIELDYMKFRVKLSDKRSVRGMYNVT